MTYNKKYKIIECDVCGEVFEEATNCLFFEEPQKNGKVGKTRHICDPESQSEWIKESDQLCIVKVFQQDKVEDFKRYNFRRVFFLGED